MEEYDAFLTGQVYGYVVFEEDEEGDVIEDHLDSCSGYYDQEHCEKEAESIIRHLKTKDKEDAEKEEEQKRLCAAIMHL